jgi:hypothetical protein
VKETNVGRKQKQQDKFQEEGQGLCATLHFTF